MALKQILTVILVAITLGFCVDIGISENISKEVPSSEILIKIENGEPINYTNVFIKGDLNFNTLNIPTKPVYRTANEVINYGLSETARIVVSPIKITQSKIIGNVKLSNIFFESDLDFTGTSFTNDSDFIGAKFNKSAVFADSQFDSDANFEKSEFMDSASFKRARFKAKANFGSVKIRGPAYFYGTEFGGPSDFSRANFDSEATFMKSKFIKYVDFRESNFNATANFWNSQFDDNAHFWDAKLNGIADFTAARFNKAARFGNTIFFKYADFRECQFGDGALFFGTQFINNAIFYGSKFLNDADFENAQFDQDAFFDKTLFEGRAIFNRSQFREDALFEGALFNDTLFLDRTKYDRLYVRWNNIKNFAYDDTAYLLLIENFRKLGFFEDADSCYYRYKNEHQPYLWAPYRLSDWILMHLYGYGVKPESPLFWSVIIILIFGFVYTRDIENSAGNIMYSPGSRKLTITSFWRGIKFSFIVFFSGTRLFVDPPKNFEILGRFKSIISCMITLERILGGLLFVLFVIAVTKTILR